VQYLKFCISTYSNCTDRAPHLIQAVLKMHGFLFRWMIQRDSWRPPRYTWFCPDLTCDDLPGCPCRRQYAHTHTHTHTLHSTVAVMLTSRLCADVLTEFDLTWTYRMHGIAWLRSLVPRHQAIGITFTARSRKPVQTTDYIAYERRMLISPPILRLRDYFIVIEVTPLYRFSLFCFGLYNCHLRIYISYKA